MCGGPGATNRWKPLTIFEPKSNRNFYFIGVFLPVVKNNMSKKIFFLFGYMQKFKKKFIVGSTQLWDLFYYNLLNIWKKYFVNVWELFYFRILEWFFFTKCCIPFVRKFYPKIIVVVAPLLWRPLGFSPCCSPLNRPLINE